jgi:hypothetical protein
MAECRVKLKDRHLPSTSRPPHRHMNTLLGASAKQCERPQTYPRAGGRPQGNSDVGRMYQVRAPSGNRWSRHHRGPSARPVSPSTSTAAKRNLGPFCRDLWAEEQFEDSNSRPPSGSARSLPYLFPCLAHRFVLLEGGGRPKKNQKKKTKKEHNDRMGRSDFSRNQLLDSDTSHVSGTPRGDSLESLNFESYPIRQLMK